MIWFRRYHLMKYWDNERDMYMLYVDKKCNFEQMLCLAQEARESYFQYLPDLELEQEERIFKDFKDRLEILDKRRNMPLLKSIKQIMTKVHFVSVMTLHDNHEMRQIQVENKLIKIQKDMDHKLDHLDYLLSQKLDEDDLKVIKQQDDFRVKFHSIKS